MDALTSSPWIPKGITKSNSTASASAKSTKSYDSVKVLGGYAFGTLHVVRHDDSPRASADGADDSDGHDGPPPLDPPQAASSHYRRPPPPLTSPRNAMMHHMGDGDIVIVLHLPEAYTVGYDSVAFTAKHFAGIRDIPAGPHFFWASHPDNAATRSGFWIMGSGRSRVHVAQWHRYNEVFVQPTRTETRIQAENVDKVYHKLPPYRDPSAVGEALGDLQGFRTEANRHMWERLTNCITTAVLKRVTADQDGGWNVHTSDRVKGSPRTHGEVHLDRTLPPRLFQSHELRFAFEQDARTYSLVLFGFERSRQAMDPTAYILSWVRHSHHRRLTDEDLIGELQLAYLVGIYLGNDACLQQWWFMYLKLFLKAHRLIIRRPTLAAAALRVLTLQLSHSMDLLQGSVLDHSDVNARHMRTALIIYKRRLKEILKSHSKKTTPGLLDVKSAFTRLEVVANELGWHLHTDFVRRSKIFLDGEMLDLELEDLDAEDERGDWAPEIVEFDEYGRQLGLVSWTD